jgi:hypothetical protein
VDEYLRVIDGRQMQEEDRGEFLGWIGEQLVRTVVEEVLKQQGGCGKTRSGPGGL